jgi:hypothetical protein
VPSEELQEKGLRKIAEDGSHIFSGLHCGLDRLGCGFRGLFNGARRIRIDWAYQFIAQTVAPGVCTITSSGPASHDCRATIAPWIVGDHQMSELEAICSFHRSTTRTTSGAHLGRAGDVGRMLSRKEASGLLDKIERHATTTRKWRGALGTLAAYTSCASRG